MPPRYLSVEGFQECTVSYNLETSTHLCFPLSKPWSCSDKAWTELGQLYGVKSSIPQVLPGMYVESNAKKKPQKCFATL